MKLSFGVLCLFAGTACGDLPAELLSGGLLPASPAISEPSATTEPSATIEPSAASGPYACEVVPVAVDSAEPFPFVSLGDRAYASECPNEGAFGQCWLTGPVECGGSTGASCGGFLGRQDASGTYWLEGGQHMRCEYSCVTDEQCPPPGSGTARATCNHWPQVDDTTGPGTCIIDCGRGERCPDGFECIDPGLSTVLADGTVSQVPRQCLQFEKLTLSGSPYPP